MEADHAGFIDGDLVETALNLPRKDFEKIVQCYKVAPAEHDSKCSFLNAQFAQKVLEDLIRLHWYWYRQRVFFFSFSSADISFDDLFFLWFIVVFLLSSINL